MLLLLLMMLMSSLRGLVSSSTLATSCSSLTETEWNSRDIAAHLKSWLTGIVTIRDVQTDSGELSLGTRRFYPLTGEFWQHFEWVDRSDYEVTHSNYPEENFTVADTDATKGFVTIGFFKDGKPQGLAWQWKSERMLEGFLYGEVDQEGKFTGDEITFLYPDLLTGLHGKFVAGEIQEARAVDIVAQRCQQGIREIKLKLSTRDDTVWRPEHSSSDQILSYTKTLDPHERKSVYISPSSIPEAEDGVFARRTFHPGDLVAYFNGVRVTEEQIYQRNMTIEAIYQASRYYFSLGYFTPKSWGLQPQLCIDIPERYRSLVSYRTTLGHKVNHQFSDQTNTYFEVVKHPLFGVIVALVADQIIKRGEEVFTNYNYDLRTAPDWYREGYKLYQHRINL